MRACMKTIQQIAFSNLFLLRVIGYKNTHFSQMCRREWCGRNEVEYVTNKLIQTTTKISDRILKGQPSKILSNLIQQYPTLKAILLNFKHFKSTKVRCIRLNSVHSFFALANKK